MSARARPTVTYEATRGPVSGEVNRKAPTNAATTNVDLSADTYLASAHIIGFISDAACYLSFADSAVNIDTTKDVQLPANQIVYFSPTGPYLALRSVTAASANVAMWKAG
jgi:hypothetical protein